MAVRHAEPASRGTCYGRMDCEVQLDAEETASRMAANAARHPDLVWSSPSARCREPAAICAGRFGVTHRVDDRLHELSFGAWEGLGWSDIEQRYPAELGAWMNDWLHVAPPGGETALQLEQRVRDWLAELDPGKVHLVVAHAGVIRALRVIHGRQAWEAAMMTDVPFLGPEVFS